MTQPASTVQPDLYMLAPCEHHPPIFSAFGEFGIGQSLELINGHDPRPLRSQSQAERPGQLPWNYLERDPGM